MNTSSPDPFAPEPMTPEEQAMAARLARIGPHGEPSPALDARIIGAAHAASRASRPATRWPALIGLAATLALAVGVTWQLKPLGDAAVDGAVVDRTMNETVSEPAAESMAAPADMPQRQPVPDPQQPVAPPESRDATAERTASKADITPAPARQVGTSPADSVPPPSAPPAPAAASVVTPTASSDKAEPIMRAAQDRATVRAEREALSRSVRGDDYRSRAMRTQIERQTAAATSPEAFPPDAAGMADIAETARMPVIQDQELEPEDWIERIRLRRDAGDIAEARESLRLLLGEHPQTLVPSDLAPLTQEQP